MTKDIAILGTGDSDIDAVEPPGAILEAASNGFMPKLVNIPGVVFPATPAAREQAARAYIAAGLAAADQGFHALYINTVGDYGLGDLRRQAGIPVTGSGEAAVRLAQSSGDRFSIVTIWPPSLGFIYEHVLEDAGAIAACKNIHFLSEDQDLETLGDEENFVTEMQACSVTSLAKIKAACRDALDNEGSDVIMLGCTCMQPVAKLLEADDIPIIEPMSAGYRYTELMLSI